MQALKLSWRGVAADGRQDGRCAHTGGARLRRFGDRWMRRAALGAVLVWTSAATSAVVSYRDIDISPERRTGGVQYDECLSEPAGYWLEEAHRAG